MTGKHYRLSAQVLLVCLFGVCVYRAFTQSFAYDEALTWEHFILAPASNIFHFFDANHHFLNSLLMRVSTTVFGVSEWSMRLPALAGAVVYFTACYRLTRTAFGDSFTMLLALVLATMNPLVLDFMVAARGYGMALALWMWAASVLLEAFTRQSYKPAQMAGAGVALGLSVMANLVFVLPAAALAGMTLYFARTRPAPTPAPEALKNPSATRARAGHKKKKLSPVAQRANSGVAPWIWFALGAAAMAMAFLALAPVDQMHSEHFYTGAANLQESLRSFASYSLDHSGPLRGQPWMHYWTDTVAFVIAPLVVVAGLIFGILRRNGVLILTAGTALFSGIATLLMHVLLNKAYPSDRTGLYFLPLVTLILVGLAHAWRSQDSWRAASFAAYTVGVLLAVQFVTEFNTRMFKVWEYDADTREIAAYLAAHRPAGQEIVRVGGSWQLLQSLAYYGVTRNLNWLELHKEKPVSGFDYYVLTPWDRIPLEQQFGLKEIYRGPVSGSALALPQPPVAAR
jgi:hypothetical protein